MKLIFLLVILGGLITALILCVGSLSKLSDIGRADRARVIASGVFTKKEYFTEAGWRNLQAGRAIGLMVFVLAAYLLLTS